MFLGRTEPELEVGVLRSGRIFRLGKRRKTKRGRRNPSLFEESEHELRSHEEKGSCDKEEDYSPISKGPKYFEDSADMSRLRCNYITPTISLEVRFVVSSLERSANMDSASPVTSAREGTPPLNSEPENPSTNSMAVKDV